MAWSCRLCWSGRRRRSEEHTSELQSPCNLVCRLLLEKKKTDSCRMLKAPTSTTTRHLLHPTTSLTLSSAKARNFLRDCNPSFVELVPESSTRAAAACCVFRLTSCHASSRCGE